MMRWPPWPAAAVATKKYTVVVVVRRLQGLELEEDVEEERRALVVEVKWKGRKKSLRLGSMPPVKRNFTKEGGIGDDGAVEWDEEFTSVCRFSGYKEEGEPLFFPWELAFTVLFNAENKGVRNRVSVFGTASLNLAEYALAASDGKEFELNIPVNVATGVSETIPSLSVCTTAYVCVRLFYSSSGFLVSLFRVSVQVLFSEFEYFILCKVPPQ